jgi:thiamine-monophosphate kinase
MAGPDEDLTEETMISTYFAPLASGVAGAFGLADDCALITPAPGHDLVVKTDPIAEGVHFLAGDAPEDIAWKALAVNVSDLAAKAATPRAYLMAISFPTAPQRGWLEAFTRGLAEAQAAFAMHLIGGDTDRRPGPVTISMTVFGEVTRDAYVPRAGAAPGDQLFVSGTLGDAALGLELRRDPMLAHQLGVRPEDTRYLVNRSRRPQPRLALRTALVRHARAAMDLSDGLAKDLGRMMRAAHTGARVAFEALPVSPPARAVLGHFDDADAKIAATGDDYEILAAVGPEDVAGFVAMAALAGVPVTRIGMVTAEPEVIIQKGGIAMAFPSLGYDHFAART